MAHMRWFGRFLVMGALVVAAGASWATSEDIARPQPAFPDLVVLNGNGFGGVGRLTYSAAQSGYIVADGLFTPHVIDGGSIRAMRPDEGGGSMAIPSALAAVGQYIYAMVPSYNSLVKMDVAGQVQQQVSYGDFSYAGSGRNKMVFHNGAFFFMHKNVLQAYGPDLRPLGELPLPDLGYNNGEFILAPASNKIYLLSAYDPRPAMDCVSGTACGVPSVTQLTINISNPRAMQLEPPFKQDDMNAPLYVAHSAVDDIHNLWLAVVQGDGEYFELRDLATPTTLLKRMKTLSQVRAVTPVAPFYVVAEHAGVLGVSALAVSPTHEMAYGEAADLQLEPGSAVKMVRHGFRLFIAAGNKLRVVDVSGNVPKLVLKQDFADSTGQLFSFDDFVVAEDLPAPSSTADRGQIQALLALDYLSPEKIQALKAQLNKLTPADDWALAPLAAALSQNGSSSYTLKPIVAAGLGQLGETAQPAIPALLATTMSGASILGNNVEVVAAVLPHIDPAGTQLLAALPEFVKTNYEAGAKHVAREVLAKIASPAAQQAIAQYQ